MCVLVCYVERHRYSNFPTGSNAWWLAHLSKNSDIEIALSEVAKVGNILSLTGILENRWTNMREQTKFKAWRVWGFGDVNTILVPSN